MVRKINESTVISPEKETTELMDKFVRFLKNKGIDVTGSYYENKAIYITNEDDAEEAQYYLKTDFRDARQNGIHIVLNTDMEKIDRVIPIEPMIDESLITESIQLPRIGKIGTDVLNEKEYVLRDLLGMRLVYDGNTQRCYAARGNNKNQLVVAVIDNGGNNTEIYVFNDIDSDSIDDFMTILANEGAGFTWINWLDDYNVKPFSFWEYIQEQQ